MSAPRAVFRCYQQLVVQMNQHRNFTVQIILGIHHNGRLFIKLWGQHLSADEPGEWR